jgi:hypothetical protein
MSSLSLRSWCETLWAVYRQSVFLTSPQYRSISDFLGPAPRHGMSVKDMVKGTMLDFNFNLINSATKVGVSYIAWCVWCVPLFSLLLVP